MSSREMASEACNDARDDLPPFSSDQGFTPPIPLGTSDASAAPDAAAAEAGEAGDGASDGETGADAGDAAANAEAGSGDGGRG